MSHANPKGVVRPTSGATRANEPLPNSVRSKLEGAWIFAEAAGNSLDGLLRRPEPVDLDLLGIVIDAFGKAAELARQASAELEGGRHE